MLKYFWNMWTKCWNMLTRCSNMVETLMCFLTDMRIILRIDGLVECRMRCGESLKLNFNDPSTSQHLRKEDKQIAVIMKWLYIIVYLNIFEILLNVIEVNSPFNVISSNVAEIWPFGLTRWSSTWPKAASQATANDNSCARTNHPVAHQWRRRPRRPRPRRPLRLKRPSFLRLETSPWPPNVKGLFRSFIRIVVRLQLLLMARSTLASWNPWGNLMAVCIESLTKTWCSTDWRPIQRRRTGDLQLCPPIFMEQEPEPNGYVAKRNHSNALESLETFETSKKQSLVNPGSVCMHMF